MLSRPSFPKAVLATILIAVPALVLVILLLDHRKDREITGKPPERGPLNPETAISAEQARALALSISGLAPFGEVQSPELITLGDENIPFLRKELKGKKAWRIVFKNVRLKPPNAYPSWNDRHNRTFSVLVSADAGRLIRISSESTEPEAEVLPVATVEWAEHQIHDLGCQETYAGFPAVAPNVSFVEALPAADGGAHLADNIEALYVDWVERGRNAGPVWIICLRGGILLMPFGASQDEVPQEDLKYSRTIIDPRTGKMIAATNGPRPEREFQFVGK